MSNDFFEVDSETCQKYSLGKLDMLDAWLMTQVGGPTHHQGARMDVKRFLRGRFSDLPI
jgi:hypothetical protein